MAERDKCQICQLNTSKYSCPKCNILYCSVECYQAEPHLQCSESFYQNWVQEEFKNQEFDTEAKAKMLEILKQNAESNSDCELDSDDDEPIPDLSSRLMNVNLDDEEAVWNKLTPDEKKEFKKLVATGNIIKILPEWEPWWKTKRRKTLIQDCGEEFDWRSLCPPVPPQIPNLMELTQTKPSPNIAYMLVNVLTSYAYTVRWFKGVHKDMPLEGISTCIALSATLRDNKIFTNLIESYVAFEDDLSKCQWVKEETIDKNQIEEDLIDIIKGSAKNDAFFSIKSAISDLNSLCSEALIVLQGKNFHLKRFSGEPPRKALLKQISKKMAFYLSWTKDYGSELVNIFQNAGYKFVVF